MSNLIEMSRITKAFGANVAVRDVSLELKSGSVHALMGENGAGKSTLMKILAGVHRPDSGEIYKDGEAVSFESPRHALDFGISTVFQELSLLPNLTIAENMFLGREPVNAIGAIDYRLMHKGTQKALGDLGLSLEPSTLVSELTIAERQFVEIAHGIKADAKIFILDEPTAALNAADVEILNEQIRRLKADGKAIVYISHRMDEIFEICDTVTVMKDGVHIATRPLSELTPESLIAMMVGRELETLFPEAGRAGDSALLEFTDFKLTQDSEPLSFTIKAGEIVALAGLEGQGQREIVRSAIGQFVPYRGTISVRNQTVTLPVAESSGVRSLKALGVGFVPEDRKEEGLLLSLSVSENIELGIHSSRSAILPAQRLRDTVKQTMESLGIKVAGPTAPVASLSGGNQQKVLLGRYLALDIDVLIIEEPTRGVDIGAKAEIYRLLRNLADSGKAILVLSRETVELIGLCDRINVVHDRTIVAEMPAKNASEHKILEAALRQYETENEL
ncbi:sugar ABC transporter ATP-binding protein [Hoeflea poritis]|uniref:Sugar ABC transporter ATP-binding protein n=1 Tax=Hoeflea poritis TaxID=2993659 RepID=A0ABT4VV41_9HYPH|nr:sugar ABC transporter ATP-binding protein [Hoeflea poritis]MDA4848566.1 sugar ABC transporter ATP-binding protein [Hoeflea poritis]